MYIKDTPRSLGKATLTTSMTHLVKDDAADLAADVDARRTDAEDAGLLEAILRVHGADGERRRQSWRYDDCDDVECA